MASQRTRPRPPVRIVHLGLGAFHRAHQAALTDAADDEREWGIAAFTGRKPDAAHALAAQDGVFTLVERGPVADEYRRVESIVEAHDGADLRTLRDRLSRPEVAIVTITATEAAYLLGAEGQFDPSRAEVAPDVAALRSGGAPRSMPGRLVDGLRARLRSGAGPLAIVPCDNLPANGAAVRSAILGLARLVDETLADDIDAIVSVVDTSVDRITPRTAAGELALVARATGWDDRAPVITEPFVSWVLRGQFPAGRPVWERAGAVFVDQLEPFEHRKLWLLNGAHTLLAAEGVLRGHTTVAAAHADPVIAAAVDTLHDAAAVHLTAPHLDVPAYRAALAARFANSRIEHRLDQIALDSSIKLRARVVPVFIAERSAGRDGSAPAHAIAAWIAALDRLDALGVTDSESVARDRARRGGDPVSALLLHLDERLGSDGVAISSVRTALDAFASPARI